MKRIILISLTLITTIVNAQDLTFFVGKNGKYGYKDKDGKVAVEPKYDRVRNFSRAGIAKVAIGGEAEGGEYAGGKWGYIDRTGREVVPIKYDQIGALPYGNDFAEGLFVVELNHKWGYVDSVTGKEIDSLKYDKAFNFKDGLGMVKMGEKVGRVNKKGVEVIPPIYDDIERFDPYRGIAAVELNGKWGYLDKMGKQIVPCKYDSVDTYFIGGKAKVKLGAESFYIDMTGKKVPE